jgi:hypothetical protein
MLEHLGNHEQAVELNSRFLELLEVHSEDRQ